MSGMRRLLFAVAAVCSVLFVACPKRLSAKQPPQLAPVQVIPLNAAFYGSAPNKRDIFVCGWFADTDEFGCYEYVFFQTQMEQ